MVTRRTAMIAGGAGALVLGALGYRAWDRGLFSIGDGPAYEPWDSWNGAPADGARRPVRAAILSANPHNTQPWKFRVEGDRITLFADRARNIGAFDGFRREMQIGLGAALENLVLAGTAAGCSSDVRVQQGKLAAMPGPDAVAVAEVTFARDGTARDPLYDQIPHRHTNRGPYIADREVAPSQLRNAALNDEVRLAFVTGAEAREAGAMIVEATKRITADAEMSEDSFRWMRTGKQEIDDNRDGVTLDTSGVGNLTMILGKLAPDADRETTDRYWIDATRNTHVATAPAFGMLLVRDRLDMAATLAVGRAWQRLHLGFTAAGIAAQPLNQPVEMIDRDTMLGRIPAYRAGLQKLTKAEAGWEVNFLFRLGYADSGAGRSPRRGLDAVMME